MSKLTIRAIRYEYGRMVVRPNRHNYRKAFLIKTTIPRSILCMMYSFAYYTHASCKETTLQKNNKIYFMTHTIDFTSVQELNFELFNSFFWLVYFNHKM